MQYENRCNKNHHSHLFLDLLLLLWECADIRVEGEGLSFKLFGHIGFVDCQSRETWPPLRHGSTTALGNMLTHWGLLMHQTHTVQDCRQLKKRQAEQKGHKSFTNIHFWCTKNFHTELATVDPALIGPEIHLSLELPM